MIRKLKKTGTKVRSAVTRVSKDREIVVTDASQLVLEREWKLLRRLFSDQREEVIEHVSSWLGTDAENLLHRVCRFHPPEDILRMLYACNPKSIQQPDGQGQYPIHKACQYGASLRVILFLLKSCRLAASAQDESGKTPLHLLSEYYPQNYDLDDPEEIPVTVAMVEIVKILCLAAPDIVNLEDKDGESALEIALECNAPLKVIKELQRASEKDWKLRRSVHSRHDRMCVDLVMKQEKSKKDLEKDTFDVAAAAAAMAALCSLEEEKRDLHGKHGKMRNNFFFIKPRRQRRNQYRANAA
mmetsp:Transcript_4095/g.4745  ORF Transcript_4095/g.4745 Transcript_4095/m.4745 type:complete len:299 (-) Transcript_4095:216-1112(-)|eukprot:CAMPEP_0194138998 /NCGR_PEP_ID=MMETSP0152-20130528/8745_1 /TAXON_ID=1049557 /ORGANISM="Thalassiothrix antarctica, Strain L6-D1" /LENGTH=298 /DNA_ID=CAMNT_0038836691 /DNA_START=14 /DNA_END=910 /DNA_ORIENTATION=-